MTLLGPLWRSKQKASYRDDEKADRIPERRRSSCDDEQEEKAYERRRGSYRDSESGKKASDKKGPYHEDESRKKTAQRILRQQKARDNANANALSRLDSTPHFVPEKEGGNVKDWRN